MLRKMRGFTLIEVMIVIAILGILGAFIIPFIAHVSSTTSEVEVITQDQEEELKQTPPAVELKEEKTKTEGNDKRL